MINSALDVFYFLVDFLDLFVDCFPVVVLRHFNHGVDVALQIFVLVDVPFDLFISLIFEGHEMLHELVLHLLVGLKVGPIDLADDASPLILAAKLVHRRDQDEALVLVTKLTCCFVG